MILVSMRKNCMGTMDFTMRIGKMKKAEEFTTYPISESDSGKILYLQSSHRWAEMNTETGEITMSARRAQYANSVWLTYCKIHGTTEKDRASDEQLAKMLEAIRGTASPMAGGNNILSVYCDNSNAALV